MMGSVFFLIGLFLLILTTLGLFIYSIVTKKKEVLKILDTVLVLIVVGIIARFIAAQGYQKPIRLTKAEIIGEYRIDTSLFNGTDAKWQHDHYKFIITPTDSIIFLVINRDTVLKTYSERIMYSSGPPDLWKVQSDSAFHVLRHPPTLFRGHNKFYYVFMSDYYGNMFFRKVNK